MLSRSSSLRRARPLLGTLVEIAATGGAAGALAEAVEAAFAAIQRVHACMSFHEPSSDVTRINRAAAGCDITLDAHTHRVLRFANQLSEASNGAFDVSIADVLVRQGLLPAVPSSRSLPPDTAHAPAATWRDLVLTGCRTARWTRKGCIDLGGIAKGYAVDQAVAVLRERGIEHAVVNAGGDLRMFGMPQPVHLRDPYAANALVAIGTLNDCAVATSSSPYPDDAGAHDAVDALVDPARRACVGWGQSVTVIAPDAMTADALTKVVRLRPEAAPELLDRANARAIVIDRRGIRQCGVRPVDAVGLA